MPREPSRREQMAYQVGFQMGFEEDTAERRLRDWDKNKARYERNGGTTPPPPPPPNPSAQSWHDVLGVRPTASYEEARSAYRQLAARLHPDKGGVHALFVQIQDAWEEAQKTKKPR